MTSSSKTLKVEIQGEHAGTRVDVFLGSLEEIHTRSRAAKLISMGLVCANGRKVKASQRLEAGDVLEVTLPCERQETLHKLDLALDIAFEDESLLVVNKPAGLVVHPATSHQDDTLVNALIAHTDDLSMGFGERRPGIVHRLDRDTSGLIVVAKNDRSHEHLASQFKAKTIHRIYWAVVYGRFKEPQQRIESHLARHPSQRKKMASTPSSDPSFAHGKRAVTHLRTVQESSGLSLLQVQLETGRTHQIRVHVSESGHPIVGDLVYGGRGREKNLKSLKLRGIIAGMDRFALHAAELGFVHPLTDEDMCFRVPWPDDLKDLVEYCGFAVAEGSPP